MQVKPEEPVTFTITGKHFGLPADPLTGRRADPLSGYLETEESGQLRCAPLVHLSDGAATCTITPKKGQIMQGHMVLWAGDTAAASTTGGPGAGRAGVLTRMERGGRGHGMSPGGRAGRGPGAGTAQAPTACDHSKSRQLCAYAEVRDDDGRWTTAGRTGRWEVR